MPMTATDGSGATRRAIERGRNLKREAALAGRLSRKFRIRAFTYASTSYTWCGCFAHQEARPPAPGHNRRRRAAWSQYHQLQLELDHEGGLPPLSLILDWSTEGDDLLVLHLGMPKGVWKFGSDPVLSWRVELPVDDDLASLVFPGTEDGPVDVTLRVDDAEREAM